MDDIIILRFFRFVKSKYTKTYKKYCGNCNWPCGTDTGLQQQNSEKRQTDTQESKEQSKTKEKKKKLDIPVDFETLQKENPDIYAWITIPGTDIDYPVVQDSTDNTYYLTMQRIPV